MPINLGYIRGHSNNTWHFRGEGGVSKNVTGQFLLVTSLVKVDKMCHMGGGGLKSAEKVSRIIWMAPYSAFQVSTQNSTSALKTLEINIKVSLGKSEEENKKQKFYHVPFHLLFSSLTKKVGFPSSKR